MIFLRRNIKEVYLIICIESVSHIFSPNFNIKHRSRWWYRQAYVEIRLLPLLKALHLFVSCVKKSNLSELCRVSCPLNVCAS